MMCDVWHVMCVLRGGVCLQGVCDVCIWSVWYACVCARCGCGLTAGGVGCLCAVSCVSGVCGMCMVHEGCGVPRSLLQSGV